MSFFNGIEFQGLPVEQVFRVKVDGRKVEIKGIISGRILAIAGLDEAQGVMVQASNIINIANEHAEARDDIYRCLEVAGDLESGALESNMRISDEHMIKANELLQLDTSGRAYILPHLAEAKLPYPVTNHMLAYMIIVNEVESVLAMVEVVRASKFGGDINIGASLILKGYNISKRGGKILLRLKSEYRKVDIRLSTRIYVHLQMCMSKPEKDFPPEMVRLFNIAYGKDYDRENDKQVSKSISDVRSATINIEFEDDMLDPDPEQLDEHQKGL